ncbi:hypothetical protein DL96DRAFT_1636445 [Flagelloscypha sp. PMI_526]|nr:hypothetical protein DL96DRAFT_1636445 [Flagelloscypha sp. PMI_526]
MVAQDILVSQAIVVDAIGPMFIGLIENTFLMGALVVQAYYYWFRFHGQDRWTIQLAAILPVFIEIAQTFIVLHDGFTLFCNKFGNQGSIFSAGLMWVYIPILGSFTSCLVKFFYTWRLYAFTGNKWISGWIFILTLLALVSGFATSAAMAPLKSLLEFNKIDRPISVCLAANLASDISIMAAMIYFLRRSRTGFKHSDTLIWRIILLSLETGGVCCLFTSMHFIFWLGWPQHTWYLAVVIPRSKLYAISLLVVLNQRAGLRDSQPTEINTHSEFWSVAPAVSGAAGTNVAFVNVEVTRHYEDVTIPPRAAFSMVRCFQLFLKQS